MNVNKPAAANPESFKYSGTVTARLPENAQLHHITEVGPAPQVWEPSSFEQSEARCDRKARATRVFNVIDPATRKVYQMHIPVGGGMDFLIKRVIEDAAKKEQLRLAKKAQRERKRALYAKRYHRYGARMKRNG